MKKSWLFVRSNAQFGLIEVFSMLILSSIGGLLIGLAVTHLVDFELDGKVAGIILGVGIGLLAYQFFAWVDRMRWYF